MLTEFAQRDSITHVSTTRHLRSLELFAGGGGMALGLHAAGFEHAALVEFEPKACATLSHNAERWRVRNGAVPPWRPHAVHLADVREFDVAGTLGGGSVDMLAGGPPCQPFSLGGVHAGMADSRNMFPAALDLVRELRPSLVLFENVAGLLRASFLPYFEYVEMQLRDPLCVPKKDESWIAHRDRLVRRRSSRSALRYLVTRQLVNAADFGIPQVRKRVFLMAVRSDVTALPIPLLRGTHSEAALLNEQCVSGLYWERHQIDRPDTFACKSPREERLSKSVERPAMLPWRTVRDAIAGLPTPIDGAETEGVLNHVGIPGARSYPGHTGSPIDRPSKTIKAGVHGVCGGEAMIRYADGTLRYMSVREAARIQSFPDSYEFIGARSHAMRLIGNAVPVELAAVVARHMRAHAGL
ncbi:MAG: DNA cytosine methyltransferase [Coriobacteriia bacterium]